MTDALYLNAAGTSWPKPPSVKAAVAAALDRDPAAWAEDFEAHHRAVARFFGLDDPATLLLTPGGTSALALAIADLPWAAGDAILISGHEHLAVERPALALRDRGVETIVAPRAGDEPVDLDFVQDTLRGRPVRLVAFTEACNVTGEILPRAELARLAHEHGALALVDGAQTAGWLTHDLPGSEVDLFAFTGHKALHGVWGVGGLYVRPGLEMRTPRRDAPNPRPGYCDGGSVDRAALAGLAAAVAWLGAPAQRDRLARARAVADRFVDAVAERARVHRHPGPHLPTVALTVSGRSPSALAAALARRDVIASGGEQCAPLAHSTLGTGTSGALRLSFGPAHAPEHAIRAAEALADII